MTAAAAEAAELLARMTGSGPAGTWSAPGRVNLIGEHTDYNDGFVLPFAIQHRTHVALAPRADGVLRVASTFDADPVDVPVADLDAVFPARRDEIVEWARYPLGVAWALRRQAAEAGREIPASGADLAFASDVPIGAGLSSSAAIEGAAAIALADTWGIPVDRPALARAGRSAENDAVGAPTGIMDQMAAMLGRADAAIFLDCRSLEARPVELGFREAGLTVLVMDTGVSHAHSTGGYRDRRDACERGARELGVAALRDLSVDDLDRAAAALDDTTFRRVRHVVTENRRVEDTVAALRERGPRAIGDLLLASHASMRDDFEISIPELDTAVQAATDAGALGARMTGGGFGGAAIALVDVGAVPDVTAAVQAAFAEAGFRPPHVFPVEPSPGAARD